MSLGHLSREMRFGYGLAMLYTVSLILVTYLTPFVSQWGGLEFVLWLIGGFSLAFVVGPELYLRAEGEPGGGI